MEYLMQVSSKENLVIEKRYGDPEVATNILLGLMRTGKYTRGVIFIEDSSIEDSCRL